MVRICPSEPFESHHDLVGMVCACNVFVEEDSAIGTSLIHHSFSSVHMPSPLLNTVHMSTVPLFWNVQCA